MTELLVGLALVAGSGGMTLGTVMTGYISQFVGVLGAVCVYLFVGSALAIVSLPATGGIHHISAGLAATPVVLVLPGLMNVAMIGSQLKVVRTAGAGVLTGGLFVGQLLMGLALDAFGAFGQRQIPLSSVRLLGGAFALLGLYLFLARRKIAPASGRMGSDTR